MDAALSVELNRRHLNPRFVRMMEHMRAERPIVRAEGCFFWDSAGHRYLDFLAGFSALSLGHNHPRVLDALRSAENLPVIVEGLNHLAAALAHNLSSLAPAGLERVAFGNSGAEVVESALKLVRAATCRLRIAACRGAFHGRTTGALALTDHPPYREAFEPLLPGVVHVAYGSVESLEAALRDRDVAGFIVEPLQGEGGMVVPPASYLPSAREVCSRYGTLMIADEVQTGLGRTGRMFAIEHDGVTPDVLLLGKALGGGVMPLSAILTTNQVFQAAGGATPRTPFASATFAGNAHACVAGITALQILVDEDLPRCASESGAYLLNCLIQLKQQHPLIADVRGQGLMIGIEFAPATTGFGTVLSAGMLNKLSHTYMSSLVLMELYQQHHILTSFTLNNLNVLRFQPPLNIAREHLDYVVESLHKTLTRLKNFPQAALQTLGRNQPRF